MWVEITGITFTSCAGWGYAAPPEAACKPSRRPEYTQQPHAPCTQLSGCAPLGEDLAAGVCAVHRGQQPVGRLHDRSIHHKAAALGRVAAQRLLQVLKIAVAYIMARYKALSFHRRSGCPGLWSGGTCKRVACGWNRFQAAGRLHTRQPRPRHAHFSGAGNVHAKHRT